MTFNTCGYKSLLTPTPKNQNFHTFINLDSISTLSPISTLFHTFTISTLFHTFTNLDSISTLSPISTLFPHFHQSRLYFIPSPSRLYFRLSPISTIRLSHEYLTFFLHQEFLSHYYLYDFYKRSFDSIVVRF